MRRFTRVAMGGILSIAILAVGTQPTLAVDNISKLAESDMQPFDKALGGIVLPKIEQPKWLIKQIEAERQVSQGGSRGAVTVTYDVTTRGVVIASLAEFKTQANETLNSARGWARMNVKFVEVKSGGQFTLVLAQANQLPTFSSGCSADYSCRAGRYVVINQDRWLGATPSWNNAGGSLREYRHMVINHEVGHWLGHDHQDCGGSGQLAPVMQQQSINLQGCRFNAWPLVGELWSTQIGIR
ncbi:MAG TPA: DUF3152 domain-containing protein [Candidatus Saccharimonadales bacterium]